ncbi:hypothetical protein BN14_10711 [Rhizoctonia solani AG-1 IB]|uniref:Transmembrane protein n=1 Tax=Thanatephorus cucumeris (strain AG1-IB / isolate 7/3/14) TaxID=1108050 RepID=M5CAX3_THACB|nr:hypothetical protein BN14_10711 [Rhizoctonia solani AG-1 IB]
MSFLRLAGAAAALLSLGLFARAAPTLFAPIQINLLACANPIADHMNKLLESGIVVKLQACLNADSLVQAKADIEICLDLIKACCAELAKIGAVNIEGKAQAEIVACVAALITLFVKVCLQLTIKFGASAVAAIIVEIDLALKLLLSTLGVCVNGIVALVLKALVSFTVDLMPELNLNLCASILAKVGVNIGVIAGVDMSVAN